MLHSFLFLFMQANIPGKQLSLALEPEAAAIHVLMDAKMVKSTKGISEFGPGAKLLVADLGGWIFLRIVMFGVRLYVCVFDF